MRQLLILAAVAGLTVARPEVYREKEDFQFSRSSTDEGSKSGYYGAQRGNMGGNYERAHNMDPLAQNQMSGLVRTVEGELGNGAKQKTGSVFTSGNTRGIYGSGNYDLSNLSGRNFQEGETHGSQDLHSHSSLTSHQGSGYSGQFLKSDQALHRTGYGTAQTHNSGFSQAYDSRHSGYNSGSSSLKVANQFEDRTLGPNSGYSQVAGYQGQDYNQGQSLSHTSTGYQGQDYDQGRSLAHTSTGYQGQDYDQGRSLSHTSTAYGSNSQSRLVSGSNPVRIIIRPGTKVVLPVAAQTYDASQSASTFDQNAITSETDVLNGQHELLKPTNKHYESSYSYRKEWEKQDTRPSVGVVPLHIPTENPYPVNSELYTDTQAHMMEQQRQSALKNHYSSQRGYNVNSASSSQSSQADYNSHSSDSNAGSYNSAHSGGTTGAYNAGAINANNHKMESAAYIGTTTGLNQIEGSNTRPKSYQSAYSYHKSWEHQGDPYVIKPTTNGLYDGQASGKLTAASLNQEVYGSHQYGSQHQSHQGYSSHSGVDCDEQGHARVARSPSSHHHRAQNREDVIGQEDLGQQTEQQWDNTDDLGQQTQTQWDTIETFGQQAQNVWGRADQQTESKRNELQDEGQQTQTLWGQQNTPDEWGKTEDLGQQTQNQWDQLNVGQQTQNTWDKLELKPQGQPELGQQTQNTWTTMDTKPSGPDTSTQDKNDMYYQSNANTFTIFQSNDQKLNTESHTLVTGTNQSSSHHIHTIWDEIKKEEIGQENEDSVESNLAQAADLGQQTQVTWGNINQNEDSFNPWHQKTEDKSELDLTNLEQNDKFTNTPNPHPWMYNQVHHHQDNRSNSNQYFTLNSLNGSHSHAWQNHSTDFSSHAQTHYTPTIGSSVSSLWDKLDNIEKETIISHRTDDEVKQNSEHQGIGSVFGIPDKTNAIYTSTTVNPKPSIITVSSTTSTPSSSDKVLSDIGRGDIEPEISSNSHDIGRGDIEPENSSYEQSKPVDLQPYKTPKEMETLSITKDNNILDKHDVVQDNKNEEDDRDLSVMSLDQQSHSNSQDKNEQSVWRGNSLTTAKNSTQSSYHYINHNEDVYHRNDNNENSNREHQVEILDQQNLHQQTLYPQFVVHQENEQASIDQQSFNFGQQNTDQQSFDFGQQNKREESDQMEQQFEAHNIGQSESFQQENKKHEAEELDQQNEQFDQVSLSGWKPDDNINQQEHKLENWGQENFDQQSQSVGWIENMDQQVQTEWKPTEDLQQQSQLTDALGPPMEDLSQQLQPAWKPTEDLQQHRKLTESFAQPMKDLNQQVQASRVATEDLHPQSQITDTFSPLVNHNKELPSTLQTQPEIVEELIVPKKVTVVNTPPENETITEKPGFWKSVGSKFTNAKDKVASWFSS